MLGQDLLTVDMVSTFVSLGFMQFLFARRELWGGGCEKDRPVVQLPCKT